MEPARITVFAGHYGSGKTTLAVNYALLLRHTFPRVALCDLDIVNPYFRTADAAGALAGAGVELIAPSTANSNVDAPAVPAGTRRIFDDKGLYAVMDLGGDDRGALALGRYARLMLEEARYEMLLVVNRYRPLTRSIGDIAQARREIEAACRVPFTGIVNSSNLGAETTAESVLSTLDFAEEAGHELGLEVKLVAVERGVLDTPEGEELKTRIAADKLFTVDIYRKSSWRV